MRRKVVLHTVYHLLRLAGVLLDWLERPLVDEPIAAGDPGGRYVPDARPVFKIIHGEGGTSQPQPNGTAPLCPRNDVPTDEQPLGDHRGTPRGV